MPSFEPISLRCIGLGLGVLLLSLALRWVAGGLWADPWRMQSVLQPVYAERGALLLGLDVTAMALLTAGVLGARDIIAIAVCTFWSTAGALLECGQHPAIVGRVLAELSEQPADSIVANSISLYLLNGRFSVTELVAAFVGGSAAFICIDRFGKA